MFSRKIRVEFTEGSQRHPCPLKWLDSFSMRNFTNDPIFDDTLPVADGQMEIGRNVPLDRLQSCDGRLVSAKELSAEGRARSNKRVEGAGFSRSAPQLKGGFSTAPKLNCAYGRSQQRFVVLAA